jgi:acyl-CoA reductase-like NAD-dependent aldehyde dehydrogenase
VTYAWREQSFVPAETTWEKPQGKNPALVMKKHFQIVGRGVGVVIGCGTFPTWNTYPGLFAALATGNAVIVKPHSNAILPAAITVRTIRAVLAENGIDPNLVSLCVADPAQRHPGARHPPGGQVGRLHRRQRVRPVADRQLPPGPVSMPSWPA